MTGLSKGQKHNTTQMQEATPKDVVELLEVVKLQNEKIFEMQEEQVKWNKQHAINLKNIMDLLNNMYQTICELKEKSGQSLSKQRETRRTPSIAPIASEVPGLATSPMKSLTSLQKTLQKEIRNRSSSFVPSSKRTTLNKSIELNASNTSQLKEVLMSIDSEEAFDSISLENIQKLIPCVVSVLVSVTESPQTQYVALQFVWEITRKHESLFRGTEGYVVATKLLHAIQFFNTCKAAVDSECPLSPDEIKWLMTYLMKYCK